ncbi:MAG: hypothetical protein IKJ68_10170 [Clostridia bacterium]|nr:hypothetical protein [Clostridia bacterium]
MIEKYLIADFLLELDYPGDSVVQTKLADYATNADECVTHIKISIGYTSADIPVKKENITQISAGSYYYSMQDSDVVFYYDQNVSKVIAKTEYSNDYKNVKIDIFELKKVLGVEDSQLTYNILGRIFGYVVQMHGGFVFHASSVCYSDAGVAFSAKSGTGKSTHTALWLQNFDGCFILNDDAPLIYKSKDESFNISGTPWAGTTGINHNVSVPLKAIVSLERGANNSIESIAPGESINFLFEGVKSPLTGLMLSNILETFNSLFANVPIYKLKCNMDPSAAHTACKTIFAKF